MCRNMSHQFPRFRSLFDLILAASPSGTSPTSKTPKNTSTKHLLLLLEDIFKFYKIKMEEVKVSNPK